MGTIANVAAKLSGSGGPLLPWPKVNRLLRVDDNARGTTL